ncbi:MAG: 2-amino-4-hydroxy-6-hydroxymethyldihydropteridine diphosphokinase, partial [SAR324 cluster bacterium]|nr:2-amino-4-hydroxy-6-hydroxymethyldihydropteridine diphosphokinase [SAR324 cluster bacterium]
SRRFDGGNFERDSGEKVLCGRGRPVGERARSLQQAREALTDLPLQEFQASSVYESLPLANMDQPLYLNQVVCGQTTLGPETLLETCLQIEKRLGRIRWEHWGPRIIDIDLLSYGNLCLRSQRLTIPHPELSNRSFVLLPLSELEPSWIHPESEETLDTIWQQWQDQHPDESLPIIWNPQKSLAK